MTTTPDQNTALFERARQVIPGGVNFLVPANMAFFHPETAGGHETREFVHA